MQVSLAALLLFGAGGGGYLYLDSARHFETTDDAFIAARQFPIAPKVAGYLSAVPVTDNQHVAAGDVIARIDDRDYRTSLAQAEAQVAAAQASIGNIDAQLAVQQSQVAQNAAQVQQQRANLGYADQQVARYGTLAKDGWGTVQDAQNWSVAAAPGAGPARRRPGRPCCRGEAGRGAEGAARRLGGELGAGPGAA